MVTFEERLDELLGCAAEASATVEALATACAISSKQTVRNARLRAKTAAELLALTRERFLRDFRASKEGK